MKRIRAVFAALLLGGLVLHAQQPKTYSFETYDQVTIRKNPTTQIGIRIAEWPGQRFILWLPEWINDLWWQWDPPVAHQEFHQNRSRWAALGVHRKSKARITAELIPRKAALLFEVRVKNLTSEDCCTWGYRIACRSRRRRTSPAATSRSSTCVWQGSGDPGRIGHHRSPAHVLLGGISQSGRIDAWQGKFKSHNQKERVDYPLMIVRSRDGRRAIGTASEDYQCVFHNHSISIYYASTASRLRWISCRRGAKLYSARCSISPKAASKRWCTRTRATSRVARSSVERRMCEGEHRANSLLDPGHRRGRPGRVVCF